MLGWATLKLFLLSGECTDSGFTVERPGAFLHYVLLYLQYVTLCYPWHVEGRCFALASEAIVETLSRMISAVLLFVVVPSSLSCVILQ